MPACFNTWKAVSKGQCKPHFDIFKSGSWNCRSQRFLVAFSWCLFQFSQEPCSSCHSSVGQIPNEFPVLQTRTEGKKSFGIMTKKKIKVVKWQNPSQHGKLGTQGSSWCPFIIQGRKTSVIYLQLGCSPCQGNYRCFQGGFDPVPAVFGALGSQGHFQAPLSPIDGWNLPMGVLLIDNSALSTSMD